MLGKAIIAVGMVTILAGFTMAAITPEGSKEESRAASLGPSTDSFQDVLATPAMISSLASKRHLNSIVYNGKRLVSVGIRGHIVYSDDGGKSWLQAMVPVSVDLTAVYFPSPQKGWAVGHDGVVLHSPDGGASWVKQLDGRDVCRIMDKYYTACPLSGEPDNEAAAKLRGDIRFLVEQGPVNPFLDVWFENESTGFIVGAFNLIFHTRDGGKSWEPWFDRTDNPRGLHFYSIRSAGQDLFLSGEQGMIWKLDRISGRFKSVQTPYAGTFFGTVGKAGSVLTFGQRGNMYRSQDGGATWQQVESGVSGTIFGGTITEEGRIILVSQTGNIISSKDDGMSFTEVANKGDIPVCAVAALDNNTLAIASMAGVLIQEIK